MTLIIAIALTELIIDIFLTIKYYKEHSKYLKIKKIMKKMGYSMREINNTKDLI